MLICLNSSALSQPSLRGNFFSESMTIDECECEVSSDSNADVLLIKLGGSRGKETSARFDQLSVGQ